jgi:hypothetical protein
VAFTRLFRRPVVIGAALVAVAGLAWAAFGWFGVQGLLVDDEVDEAAPVFTATTTTVVAPESPPDDALTTTTPTPAPVSGQFRSRSHPTRGRATVLTGGAGERVLRLEEFATDNGPDVNVYLSTAAPDAPAGDFRKDFVDLGDLKGNIGSQNYAIPAGVDLGRYRTVVIWCVRFSVAFGTAGLT